MQTPIHTDGRGRAGGRTLLKCVVCLAVLLLGACCGWGQGFGSTNAATEIIDVKLPPREPDLDYEEFIIGHMRERRIREAADTQHGECPRFLLEWRRGSYIVSGAVFSNHIYLACESGIAEGEDGWRYGTNVAFKVPMDFARRFSSSLESRESQSRGCTWPVAVSECKNGSPMLTRHFDWPIAGDHHCGCGNYNGPWLGRPYPELETIARAIRPACLEMYRMLARERIGQMVIRRIMARGLKLSNRKYVPPVKKEQASANFDLAMNIAVATDIARIVFVHRFGGECLGRSQWKLLEMSDSIKIKLVPGNATEVGKVGYVVAIKIARRDGRISDDADALSAVVASGNKIRAMGECRIPSEAGVLIAERILRHVYGERVLRQRPWIVTAHSDNVLVEGMFHGRGVGGVARIRISLRDGHIMEISHGK